jgi:ureidoglycolate dehydrogenase (NAD+)
MRIAPERLLAFAAAALKAAGASDEAAEAAAFAMMHGSLHGIESHGIRLLPWYCEQIRTKLVKGAPDVTIERKRRAAVLVDADGGFGHLASYRAMDEACAAARDCGIGMAGVINSAHFGAAGAYALAAADAGFIGFVTCNASAAVTPFNSAEPIHGTNPIAFAAPNAGGDPFLLDMATSSIPWNRVLRSRTEHMPLPPQAALDDEGRFTEDAEAARALAPLGGDMFGYKGAALAGVAEILAGALTGMRLSTEHVPGALGDTGVGHFLMAIDPELFIPADRFAGRMAGYMAGFAARSSPERPVYAAGGPQWIARNERQKTGIPILPGLMAELSAEASIAGVDFP